MKTFLRAVAPILLVALFLPAPAGAAGPRLQRCDLGLPRPFRCGHVVVPMRRADPALGATKVAFAMRRRSDRDRPSLGTIVGMDGGPGYASTAAPYARSWSRCSRRCCAAMTSSSSTSAAPGAPTWSTARLCSAG